MKHMEHMEHMKLNEHVEHNEHNEHMRAHSSTFEHIRAQWTQRAPWHACGHAKSMCAGLPAMTVHPDVAFRPRVHSFEIAFPLTQLAPVVFEKWRTLNQHGVFRSTCNVHWNTAIHASVTSKGMLDRVFTSVFLGILYILHECLVRFQFDRTDELAGCAIRHMFERALCCV